MSTDLFPLFISTAGERIASLRSGFESLQNAHSKEVLEKAHLDAHSLKGEAYLMGFKVYGDYCTLVEKYLKPFVGSEVQIPVDKMIILNQAVGKMDEVLSIISTSQKEPEWLSGEVPKLREILGVQLPVTEGKGV